MFGPHSAVPCVLEPLILHRKDLFIISVLSSSRWRVVGSLFVRPLVFWQRDMGSTCWIFHKIWTASESWAQLLYSNFILTKCAIHSLFTNTVQLAGCDTLLLLDFPSPEIITNLQAMLILSGSTLCLLRFSCPDYASPTSLASYISHRVYHGPTHIFSLTQRTPVLITKAGKCCHKWAEVTCD